MNKKGVILLALFSAILINLTLATTTAYSREFQFTLDKDLFTNGRDGGIDQYMNAFAQAAGIDLDTSLPSFTRSIREEIEINSDHCSNTKGFFSERDYQWGDWNGTKITQVKTTGSLDTANEALDEPFRVSSTYSNYTITYIEYDIHPCEADWSSTSRITTTEFPTINTCSDLQNIFPDALSGSGKEVSTRSLGYTYTAFRNGTYLGGQLTLDCTLSYDSLDDAINDNNFQGGEFSFTMYAADQKNGVWSQEQTDKSVQIYEDMLADLGSGKDYPCNPPVDVNDFFVEDNNGNPNRSSNNNNNNSSDSSLLLPSLLLFFITFLF